MPLPGGEFEVLIFLRLRTPLGAESINDGALLGDCGDNGAFHGVLQIVVHARNVTGHDFELVHLDDAAANEVLGDASRLTGKLPETGGKRGELLRERRWK